MTAVPARSSDEFKIIRRIEKYELQHPHPVRRMFNFPSNLKEQIAAQLRDWHCDVCKLRRDRELVIQVLAR